MTEEDFQKEIDQLDKPEAWENCVVELEHFIFGASNLANRYTPHELVAALLYLNESMEWKANHVGEEHEWLHSRECEGVVQKAYVIAETGKI